MNNMDAIDALLLTLNAIDVRGKSNLDRMLGCIRLLEQLKERINTEENGNGKQDD